MQIVRCSLFALAAVLHAQQGGASLDGQVTNAVTGEPVPNATLHLLGLRYIRGGNNSSPETTSQAEGMFHFDSLAPGSYVITAEHPGFVPNELNTRSRLVDIAPGQSLTGVSVTLTPEGTLSGRVEEDDGTAVAGARVQALAPLTTHGRTSLKLYASADANARGRFLLPGLPPNSYYVVAEPPDSKKPASADGALVRTIYPRSLEIEGGSTIPVTAGQSIPDITVRIRRSTTSNVRGKIADPSNDMAGANLTLTVSPRGAVDSPSLARKISLNLDRTFDIGGLTPGAYTLRLTGGPRRIGRSRALLARQEIEVGGANLDGIVLTVMPPLTVVGQVRVDAPASTPLPLITVTARPLEELFHSSLGSARMAADGSLAFTPLDPALYVFRVISATSGWYVKSLTLNQQDILNKPADLSEASSARLDVLMSPAAAEVAGSIVQNSSVESAGDSAADTVILVPETVGPDGSGILFAYAAKDGTFAVKSIRPGKYLAYATQRGDPNLWQNPDFLKAVENQGTGIELQENSRLQLQLPLLTLDQVEQSGARLGLHVQ